jgi:hypothetical protein
MMAQVLLMALTVEQQLGVMVPDRPLVLTAVQQVGVMVPDQLKARVVVRRVGIVVPVALQHQLAENLKAGVDKRFIS